MCTEAHFHLSTSPEDLLPLSPQFRWGGLFSFLGQKSASKLQKHAILHTFQVNGGAIAPFAPLATLLHLRSNLIAYL